MAYRHPTKPRTPNVHARRITWTVILGVCAAAIALVVAPQVVFVVELLCGSWMPGTVLQPLRHAAFELGLWMCGLAVWFVARRFGWLQGRVYAVILVAIPMLSETGLMFGLGRLTGGIASPTGILTRLLIGGLAIGLAIRSARWPLSDSKT
ncbi:MAG: hypothetical protein A2289_17215 [Deltaproteobacteria bacterium RIFOXYA12_FULL_58_15]|nr:MAG: hypothetical protein A2289_17215 [Deltaproteobacteria bacterium RIFOXYA12_FULL_58_15]